MKAPKSPGYISRTLPSPRASSRIYPALPLQVWCGLHRRTGLPTERMNPVLSRNADRLNLAPVLVAALAALLPVSAFGQALALDVPLPPPPPGMKEVPLPPAPPGLRPLPAPAPRAAPGAPGERCLSCHAAVAQKSFLHPSLDKNDCTACHSPQSGASGKCRSRSASKWTLKKQEPELCYGCHARKDQSKSVHTVVRQGSCLSCHAAHSSNFAGVAQRSTRPDLPRTATRWSRSSPRR